ncbi:MAG: LysR family transcriptional regulator [Gammaproteobacteria bacterium HGW-Gammaproteobacteria-14]|nr:MAG: LysR family transcriptional regulator [Gammaproteobacteria bacterium HGW-Gammaproteobacteria-14]
MKYTLRQLQVFLAIAHHQNLTRAASSLAMSQSAASSSLKELEQQFDIKLFDRIGKRLQLNELGQLIRPKAEALMSAAAGLEQSLSQQADAGLLKVGATLTIGNYLAVPIVARYMAENEQARVAIEVANTQEIAAKVCNFEIDVGLIEGEFNHPDILITPWQEDELEVFCAPGHPLAQRNSLSDADLLEAIWILREPGSGTRQTFDRAMHGLLPQLSVLLELQHTEAIKRAVEAGLGIGCLSRVTLTEAFRRGSLTPLPVPHRDFRRHFYFLLHRHKYLSVGVRRWITLCQNLSAATESLPPHAVPDESH